jgi:hypothetical protein
MVMDATEVPFSLESLERAVLDALESRKVYDIGSYGWSGPDEMDPDYIGHAMWQTDPPNIDFEALQGASPVRRRPDVIEKEVLTLGEDFYGLMQASRLSIGHMLLWTPSVLKSIVSECSFFWAHYIDVYVKLAMASERLRDLLIVACTSGLPAAYENGPSRTRKYVSPFKDAGKLLSNRAIETVSVNDSLRALPGLAARIYPFIGKRNAIVHDVATELAAVVSDSVRRLQTQFDEEQRNGFAPRRFDAAALSEAVASDADRRQNIEGLVKDVVDWHRLLIDASNHVFRIEHCSRRTSSGGPKGRP